MNCSLGSTIFYGEQSNFWDLVLRMPIVNVPINWPSFDLKHQKATTQNQFPHPSLNTKEERGTVKTTHKETQDKPKTRGQVPRFKNNFMFNSTEYESLNAHK